MPEQKPLPLSAVVDVAERFGPYLCGAALIVFVLFRTGSFFFVFYRIQSWIGGAQAFHNERVQKHWKSFEDMHRLNLWFGLGLTSSQAMHRLFAWLDRHNVGVEEIARSVPYFDANKLQFFFPSLSQVKVYNTVATMFGTLLIGAAILFAVPDYALLYVNKTNTLFWVNSGQAYSMWYLFTSNFDGSSWHVGQQYCLFSDATAPFKDDWDKRIICHLVLGNEGDYLGNTIQSQRYLSAFLSFMFLFFSVPSVRLALKRKQARIIQQRIEANEQLRLAKQGKLPSN